MTLLFGWWYNIPLQRRKRIVLFVLATVVLLVTLWVARGVLGLFLIGIVLAYLISPLVSELQGWIEWLAERIRFGFLHNAARSLSIIIVYLLFVAAIAGFVYLVIPIVVREAQALWAAREMIGERITNWGDELIQQYELLPDGIRVQIDEAMQNLSAFLTQAVQTVVEGTFTAISYTTGLVLGVTVVPFWVFFLLRDYSQIRSSVYRSLPLALREDLRSILRMLDHTIGAYLRGQILLMIIIGVLQTFVMSLIGLDYALLLGVIAGLLEIIPSVGPTLAAVPAVLIALAQGPVLALITAVAANLIQNVENSFIVPRVLGESVGLHPVVIMVVLVIGAEIAGLPGLILAPILTAVLRDVYRYLSYRFADTPLSPGESLARALDGESFAVDI